MSESHDHSSHESHDHSSHSSHAMTFYISTSATVLFDVWNFSTIGGLVGSMIGIFFMAVIYEGLKYYRETLLPEAQKGNDEEKQIKPTGFIKRIPLNKLHFYQTGLHVVQITLSYLLMLIFMTYNMWLCIAVAVGSGVGYFLFGWKKSSIVDITEHCQ